MMMMIVMTTDDADADCGHNDYGHDGDDDIR